MRYPTPLMLALSAAVLLIDPSIPLPCAPAARCLEENAPHWRAVASYAEAFPGALAKKVESARSDGDVAEGSAERVAAEAREIKQVLGVGEGLA